MIECARMKEREKIKIDATYLSWPGCVMLSIQGGEMMELIE